MWLTTGDELADGLTKEMDGEPILKVMRTGRYTSVYSTLSIRRGLLDEHKGLPPPKSQKKASSQDFVALWHQSAETFSALLRSLKTGEGAWAPSGPGNV